MRDNNVVHLTEARTLKRHAGCLENFRRRLERGDYSLSEREALELFYLMKKAHTTLTNFPNDAEAWGRLYFKTSLLAEKLLGQFQVVRYSESLWEKGAEFFAGHRTKLPARLTTP